VKFLSSSADPGRPVAVSRLLDFHGVVGDFTLPGEAHLCLVSLEANERILAACNDLLEPQEKNRAQRFVSVPARHRFVVSRAVLRKIIRIYRPELPPDFVISHGPFGKPHLESPEQESPLRFNVSHSGNFALLGFSHDAEIGVDIEEQRQLEGMVGMARTVFTEPEVEQLLSLSEPARQMFFYRLWTCKEAWLKAAGTGFHRDPKSLCFSAEMERLDQQSGLLPVDGQFIQWATHPSGYAIAWALRSTLSPTIRWIDL